MTRQPQVDFLIKNAFKELLNAFFKYIYQRLKSKVLMKLYYTYISPIIEFTNLPLCLNQTQNQRIESIQRNNQ